MVLFYKCVVLFPFSFSFFKLICYFIMFILLLKLEAFDINLFYDLIRPIFSLSFLSLLLSILCFYFSNKFFLFLFKFDFISLAFFTVVSTGFIYDIYIIDYLKPSDDMFDWYISNWDLEFYWFYLAFWLLIYNDLF